MDSNKLRILYINNVYLFCSKIVTMSCEFRGTFSRRLYPVDDLSIFYSEPSLNSRKLVKKRNLEHERWLQGQMEHYERQLRVNKFAEDPRTAYGTVFDVENVPNPVHSSNELIVIGSQCCESKIWYNVGISEKKAAWVFVNS